MGKKIELRNSSKRTPLPNRFGLTKRRRFLIVSLFLTVGLFIVQRMPSDSRIIGFGVYGALTYILCAWSLFKELRGIAWFTNLILPTMYPVSVGLFYFLLPQEPMTRLIVAFLFLVSMYALLLTANIFAVASIRTIQLLRAARAVGFLLTVLTAALLFHFIFSLRLSVVLLSLFCFIVALLLFAFGVWSYTLGERWKAKELAYILTGAIVLLQAAFAISFWQVDVALVSIFLAMIVYVSLGLMQHEIEERLFTRTLQEYVGFGMIVFGIIVVVVMSRWMA